MKKLKENIQKYKKQLAITGLAIAIILPGIGSYKSYNKTNVVEANLINHFKKSSEIIDFVNKNRTYIIENDKIIREFAKRLEKHRKVINRLDEKVRRLERNGNN